MRKSVELKMKELVAQRKRTVANVMYVSPRIIRGISLELKDEVRISFMRNKDITRNIARAMKEAARSIISIGVER